jgi:hypothetical protein
MPATLDERISRWRLAHNADCMPNTDLLKALVARLQAARAKVRLELLLKQSRQDQGLSRRAFRASGTMEELAQAVFVAAEKGALTPEHLARVVDEVEENGGQHIFLFDLTPDGVALVRSGRLQRSFTRLPPQPTVAMYSELPAATRTYLEDRGPDGLAVKQIARAAYWERDEENSYSEEDRRVVATVRRQRRAVNLFKVNPLRAEAEIRIDRVRNQMDDVLATALFQQFKTTLEDVVDFERHLTVTPIWNGFRLIVNDLETTYMSTDSARDPSVSVHISNRRDSDRGTDVRQHISYRYTSTDYTRDSLNIYWRLAGDGEENKVHSILSRTKLPDRDYSKVYVAAKIERDQLSHVIERIRQFTRDAS